MIVFLAYERVKGNLIKYKCLSRNKYYSNKTHKELKKRFTNKYKFSNNDINKFFLLLRKGVFPYGYMVEWGKFYKLSLPEKKEFYSNLNVESITNSNCNHAKRACKDFEMTNYR